MSEKRVIEPVMLDDENSTLVILDQTLVPNDIVFLKLTDQGAIWEAIYELRVRGAPAIGIAAAFGAYLGIKESKATTYDKLYEDFKKVKEYLASSRPTAVNLFWALDRMEARFKKESGKTVAEVKEALKDESINIKIEDEVTNKAIGEYSLSLLKDGMGLLTHCNPGALATSKYGTATAPIYLGQEQGMNFQVYVDETRPLLQGARLTAFELQEAGIDATLICDNMASIVMKEKKVQAVLVGCDRVAVNGDTANKIGTSGVAIIAKHYGVPVYVHAPLSTIDLNCKDGNDIEIELRPGEEITSKWYSKPMGPKGIKTYNPCFDVTDNSLITAIITEKGIAFPPFNVSVPKLFDN